MITPRVRAALTEMRDYAPFSVVLRASGIIELSAEDPNCTEQVFLAALSPNRLEALGDCFRALAAASRAATDCS